MDEQIKILDECVRNEIVKLIMIMDADCFPEAINFTCALTDGNEVSCQISLNQSIKKNRQYHHWYGGEVAWITLSCNGKIIDGDLLANGDIRALLTAGDGSELCRIKDRRNGGGFCDFQAYIPDDNVLADLLNPAVDGQDIALLVDDSNWWELFSPNEIGSVVLDGYSFTDALVESVICLYGTLENIIFRRRNEI